MINTIEANTRTEDLLTQSQTLAQELQSRQEELQNTNQELQEKARLLAHQNQEVERKNAEVEQARQALEEKARQLALTSKYKSEFLANMSHELRTPLNSLLILSDQLSGNAEGNLTGKQVEFARTIHSSGNDLLMLINDILDLSKIESGTVAVDVGEVRLDELQRFVERTFRHVAETKGLAFEIRMDPRLPKSISTDAKRLQQILRNLLSNAFKFTHKGEVNLVIRPAAAGWSADNEDLNRATDVIEFSVTRHRHRHPDGQAADHLRGVPAGRRLHQPQVRRHGPGPRDLARALAPAARRDPPGERAQQGQRLLALPAAGVPAVARGAQVERRRRRGDAPRSRPRAMAAERRVPSAPALSTSRAASADAAARPPRRRSTRPTTTASRSIRATGWC